MGGVVTALALVLLLVVIAGILTGAYDNFLFKVAVFGIFISAPAIALLLGIAWRNPVAIRIDSDGISGFITAPAQWHEIDKIGRMNGPNGSTFIGFSLVDPIGFRNRQTPWQRLTSHLNGKADGYHIALADTLLDGGDIDALVAQARTFHAAAKTAQ